MTQLTSKFHLLLLGVLGTGGVYSGRDKPSLPGVTGWHAGCPGPSALIEPAMGQGPTEAAE